VSDLVWKEPPSEPQRQSWSIIAAELLAHPGEWAIVAEKPNSAAAANVASQIKRGVYSGMSAGEFEAVARTVDGVSRVYARYAGSAS
jgi:hypothetical protein